MYTVNNNVCVFVCFCYRCERHLKVFGRESEEMKIAKYFGEKVIFTQQQNLVIYPRAVVTYLMMSQQNKVDLGLIFILTFSLYNITFYN